uniref:Uncharacterized protein n=1 Tax=Candidatus Kentrum sp. TC TaxID=2126339 RepID=A0A450YA98_9GAMM|nr:MAG: hypothetical protein BECKTC1821E_GA0114239_100275 [Candidatus Kentron sp. TC]
MRRNGISDRSRKTSGRRSIFPFIKGSFGILVVIFALLAFALSIREGELERFNKIKPLFEIGILTDEGGNKNGFRLLNHGGIVYFVGSSREEKGKLLMKTPRKYSVLKNTDKKGVEFRFSKDLSEGDALVSYWRDVDLNTYSIKIELRSDGFYIADVPAAFRSNKFTAMPGEALDNLANYFFPKDWFALNPHIEGDWSKKADNGNKDWHADCGGKGGLLQNRAYEELCLKKEEDLIVKN